MKKFLIATTVAVSLLFACSAPSDTLSKIKKEGKLVVGTSADYAPYEFHAMIDGADKVIGFDIDIVAEVAREMGVKLEVQDVGFDGLLQSLNSNKIDLVISGMTPTDERKKSVDFSAIYYFARQGVLIRAEDVGTIKTIADLKGKKVGAQLSSTQEKIVKEQFAESVPVSLGKIPDLVLELKNRKVDAIVVELPVAKGYVANNPDLFVSEVKLVEDEGGSAIAIKKGNETLLAAVNKTLMRLMSDGSIDLFVTKANEQNIPK